MSPLSSTLALLVSQHLFLVVSSSSSTRLSTEISFPYLAPLFRKLALTQKRTCSHGENCNWHACGTTGFLFDAVYDTNAHTKHGSAWFPTDYGSVEAKEVVAELVATVSPLTVGVWRMEMKAGIAESFGMNSLGASSAGRNSGAAGVKWTRQVSVSSRDVVSSSGGKIIDVGGEDEILDPDTNLERQDAFDRCRSTASKRRKKGDFLRRSVSAPDFFQEDSCSERYAQGASSRSSRSPGQRLFHRLFGRDFLRLANSDTPLLWRIAFPEHVFLFESQHGSGFLYHSWRNAFGLAMSLGLESNCFCPNMESTPANWWPRRDLREAAQRSFRRAFESSREPVPIENLYAAMLEAADFMFSPSVAEFVDGAISSGPAATGRDGRRSGEEFQSGHEDQRHGHGFFLTNSVPVAIPPYAELPEFSLEIEGIAMRFSQNLGLLLDPHDPPEPPILQEIAAFFRKNDPRVLPDGIYRFRKARKEPGTVARFVELYPVEDADEDEIFYPRTEAEFLGLLARNPKLSQEAYEFMRNGSLIENVDGWFRRERASVWLDRLGDQLVSEDRSSGANFMQQEGGERRTGEDHVLLDPPRPDEDSSSGRGGSRRTWSIAGHWDWSALEDVRPALQPLGTAFLVFVLLFAGRARVGNWSWSRSVRVCSSHGQIVGRRAAAERIWMFCSILESGCSVRYGGWHKCGETNGG